MKIVPLALTLAFAVILSASAHEIGQCKSEFRAYVNAMDKFTELMDAYGRRPELRGDFEWHKRRDLALLDLALVSEKYVACSITMK